METVELKKGLQIKCKHGICRDKIRQRIAIQAHGTRLPGSRTLAEEYGVNIKTIRKSLKPLIAEGLLSLENGRGLFVVGKIHYHIGIVGLSPEKDFLGKGYTGRVFNYVVREIDQKGDGFSYQRKNPDHEYVSLFQNNKMINGLLIFAPKDEDKEKLIAFRNVAQIPFMVIGATHPGSSINFVDSDNLLDSYNGVKYLTDLGHRKIAFISDRKLSPAHTLRLAGYQRALQGMQIPFNDSLIVMEDPYEREFAIKLKELFKGPAEPTAAFGGNLEAVMKTTEILNEKTLKKITMLVYDDIDFRYQPCFGSYGIINQPYRQIGETAVEKLYQLMTHENSLPVQILMKSQVVFPK